MYSRLILVLLLVIQSIILNESSSDNFVAVSTTNRSPPADNNEELTTRLKSLESENVLIHKILESYNSSLSRLEENLQTQNTQIRKKLEIIESNLHEIKNTTTHRVPKNCKEIQERGHKVSKVYFIQPELAPEPFPVLCDMETRGGGWTYILNRFNGSQKFDLDWENYKVGFGLLDVEFWLGLENIHHLTGHEFNELLVELVDWDLKKVYALYSSFSIGNGQEGYRVKLLGEYSGDAGDSFSHVRGMKFSTKDHDRDLCNCNCAAFTTWWYNDCQVDAGQLTGIYSGRFVDRNSVSKVMFWRTFHKDDYSLKEAKMMVRPVS